MTRNWPSLFLFCPWCGTSLVPFIEEGFERRQCPECKWIQYRNPTVGVAAVILEDNQLLLGQRRDGTWCIPCGHVEWNESIEEAARRELLEETGLEVALSGVLSVQSNFHAPERQTVGIWFRGHRMGGQLQAGGDLTAVGFFNLQTIPTLAFPTDERVVQLLGNSSR